MRISDWSSDVCSSDLRLIDCSTRTVHGAQMTETSAIVHDPREEFASALTHGVGAAAALAGGAVLIALAALHGDGWQLTAAIVFGICLRSEEHTSELQSLMRISYAVFCLQNKIS